MKRHRSRGLRRAVFTVLFIALMGVSMVSPATVAQDATPAAQSADLSGVAPLPLTGERRA